MTGRLSAIRSERSVEIQHCRYDWASIRHSVGEVRRDSALPVWLGVYPPFGRRGPSRFSTAGMAGRLSAIRSERSVEIQHCRYGWASIRHSVGEVCRDSALPVWLGVYPPFG